ncbi:MAG: hypothetical protein M1833_006354 [Piccolia ochrophora]|nr:MAG: hypothetical protein M1833_006354 [Piccolia ochrophora]
MASCCRRKKHVVVRAEQKWSYINLSDFKSSSCWTPMSYGVLYIALFISIFVHVSDTFIAINLLAFNRWSSQVEPASLYITKWIFAGCIILSVLNLAYEWTRAVRVMRDGGITDSYLDPLAVRVQCIRMGKDGRGWRRFLVFAELTKSKKGVEYVALFAYFSFMAWFRVIFAEGPRKVINAITLYGVLNAKLIPKGDHAPSDGNSPFAQFWINFGLLANESRIQAAVLLAMLITLVIWIVSMLCLLIACILYILFLWHYIPSADGSLYNYCRRKVDGKLTRIVGAKVQKALDKEEDKRRNLELRAIKAGEKMPSIKREPTIPILANEKSEKLTPLSRVPTDSTLPPYSSRPPTRGTTFVSADEQQPTLPNIAPASRTAGGPATTLPSAYPGSRSASARDDIPLIGGGGGKGFTQSPQSYLPPWGAGGSPFNRKNNNNPAGSYAGIGPQIRAPQMYARGRGRPGRGPMGYPHRPVPPTGRHDVPGPHMQGQPPMMRTPPNRMPIDSGMNNRRLPGPPPQGFPNPPHPGPSHGGSAAPAFHNSNNVMVGLARSPSDGYELNNVPTGYFPNNTHSTHRNMSDPSNYRDPPPMAAVNRSLPQRSGTAPPGQAGVGYNYSIYDAYGAEDIQAAGAPPMPPPPRAATTGPGGGSTGYGRGPSPPRRDMPGVYTPAAPF